MTRGRNVPLWTAIIASAVVLGLVAVHAYVRPLPGLETAEGLSIDARFRLRGPRHPGTNRVVIVGIDDETRARHPEVLQTRAGYASLIGALTSYNAKVVALDLFFSSPEVVLPAPLETEIRNTSDELHGQVLADPTASRLRDLLAKINDELRGDEQLTTAIDANQHVFLGAYFVGGPGASGAEPAKLKLARHGEAADSGGGGFRRPVHAYYVNFTMDSIGAGAIGAGALNSYRDRDGVTRRVPLAVEYAGHYYMPLGLAVALYDMGKAGDTSYLAGREYVSAAGKQLPVTVAASIPLDFMGRGKIARVSAADVLDGKVAAGDLKDKLVFVGMTYAAYDKIQTPLDNVADGVELHATLAENILANHLLRVAGPFASVLVALLLCAIVIAAQLRPVRRRAWIPPVIAIGGIFVYYFVAYSLFRGGLIVPVAAPIIMTAVVLVAAGIATLATEGREKAHLRAVFSQYVSKTVVDKVLADPARAKLGGERKELTVLFSDIRGFSAFAEGMGPEALASFLGEYLTPMTDLVLESGGTLDKYIGDAVMAIWAAPVDVPDHAARACDVALRMQEALVDLNKRWKTEGKPEVAIGIGINTGPMSVGNMGTPARFDYTVLGDQVNLGARLEALTKEYGVDILVGEATAKAAGAKFVFREVDVVRVKGRAGSAPVYELVGRAGVDVDARFAEALATYRRRDFASARTQFAALIDDATAQLMAKRCAELAASPPPEGWDGVYEQRSK